MDVSLLKFMSRRVRLISDPSGGEYEVAGINWDTSDLLIFLNDRPHWIHNTKVELIDEEEETDDTD